MLACIALQINGILKVFMQVKLLDFNSILGTTNPLLFSWEELGFHHPANATGSEQDGSQQPSQNCSPSPATQAQKPAEDIGRRNGGHEPGKVTDQVAHGEASFPSSCKDIVEEEERHLHDERLAKKLEIRVVTEANRVQPNMPTYGVPYDLIDTSETSAYTDLIEKLRDREMQDSQD